MSSPRFMRALEDVLLTSREAFLKAEGRMTRVARAIRPSRALTCFQLSQRSEPYAHLFHQYFWLFPRRKVTALFDLVVMNESGISPLGPTPRRMVLLVRKDAHSNRDRDVLGSEVDLGEPFPIETGSRDRRVRQPE